MSFFPILLLGIIQGITEFLPISSSGHLLVASKLFEMEQNLLLDVSLHLGTLFAIIIYFQKEVVSLLLYASIFSKKREVKVEIENLPSFVYKKDCDLEIPDLGTFKIDDNKVFAVYYKGLNAQAVF